MSAGPEITSALAPGKRAMVARWPVAVTEDEPMAPPSASPLPKLAAAREIAMAFGVPPMLIGIPGDATYANYAEANRAFYRLTVLPLATRVAASLGWWLSEHLGAEIDLKPDLDQIPALAEERDQHWARVGAAGFLTDA